MSKTEEKCDMLCIVIKFISHYIFLVVHYQKQRVVECDREREKASDKSKPPNHHIASAFELLKRYDIERSN